MDLVASVRKEGSRGGRADFKWSDVQTDQHRENYLGHSVMAPVGRWQKGRDLQWYAKSQATQDDESTSAADKAKQEREEEIRRIKNAEREALSKALGYEVNPDGPLGSGAGTGANSVAVARKEGSMDGGDGGGTMIDKKEVKRRERRHHHRHREEREEREGRRQRHQRHRSLSQSRSRSRSRNREIDTHRYRRRAYHDRDESRDRQVRRRSRSRSYDRYDRKRDRSREYSGQKRGGYRYERPRSRTRERARPPSPERAHRRKDQDRAPSYDYASRRTELERRRSRSP